MKCDHKNINIIEDGIFYGEHTRENGEWSSCDNVGPLTGNIEVVCLDCGYTNRFTRKSKKPKWLLKALSEIGI